MGVKVPRNHCIQCLRNRGGKRGSDLRAGVCPYSGLVVDHLLLAIIFLEHGKEQDDIGVLVGEEY